MKPKQLPTVSLLLLCAALLLGGCIEIHVQSLVTPTVPTPTHTSVPTDTPVPTDTVMWFPPTSTPRPLNTPTPFPTVNQLPSLGELLLEDDFSDASTWQTYRSASGNAVIANNELTLAVQDSAGLISSYASLPQYGDYFLSVNVDLSICTYYEDWYGIAFRVGDSENYYRWLFNCLGQTRVDRVYQGRIYVMKDWTANGVIRNFAPQKFRAAIAAEGGALNFYANDTLLMTLEDSVFTAGGYGLLLYSTGISPLSVSFSDFSLYEMQPGSAPQLIIKKEK